MKTISIPYLFRIRIKNEKYYKVFILRIFPITLCLHKVGGFGRGIYFHYFPWSIQLSLHWDKVRITLILGINICEYLGRKISRLSRKLSSEQKLKLKKMLGEI